MQLFSQKKALVLSLGALFALGACGDDVTVPVAPDAVVVISITPPNATMNIGESLNFAVQITGGSTTTPPTLSSCTSSNNAVATAAVQAGACRVTAVASGNVTVTAKASTNNEAAASVTVAPAAAAINTLTTSPTQLPLSVGQNGTIVPNVNKAAASVTVTYGYATSNSAIASVNATSGVVTAVAPGVATITVTATGSGTGYTTAVLTAGVTVTVTAAPPALTGMTVQPTDIDMAVGSTRQIATVVTAAAGITVPTPQYVSNNTAVATVGATSGLVTAVAPGNAQITVTATSAGNATLAATTLTQLVEVRVSPIANLTIEFIRQGPTVTSYDNSINEEGLIVSNNAQVNQPVDFQNTRDQIQVTITLQTNGQRVDSVVAYIADGNGANRRAAARQQFTNGNANTSTIEFIINTADFTVNWATGAVDVIYPNGLRILSASVWTTGPTGIVSEIQNASNNRTPLNFNNLDSWAARYIAPSRVAQGGAGSNGNLNWWGGPDVAGQGNWTIAPVFYTPGRTVRTVTTELSQIGDNGAGLLNHMNGNSRIFAICGNRTYTNASTLPWNTTFGYTNLPTNSVNCLGYEQFPLVNGLADMRDLPTLYAVIDNNNNPGPFMRRLNGYRTSVAVVQPAPLRLDYAVASVDVGLAPQIVGADSGWVNALYSFVTSTGESDAGVGLPTPLGQTYTWTGCITANGGTNVAFDGLVKAIGAAGELPECNNDFLGGVALNGPYTVTAFQPDVLGNIGSDVSNRFGADKRNPELTFTDEQTLSALGAPAASRQGLVVRINADSIFDNVTTTFTSSATALNPTTAVNSTNALFGARYRDERAGFRLDNHGTRGLTRWAPAASPLLSNVSVSTNQISSTTRTLNYDGSLVNQESIQDAGDPTYRRDSIAIFGNNGGTSATAGYYFYNIKVVDRAGNFSTANRTAAIDITSPQLTGVTIPAVLQGGAQLVFGPTGSDDLESLDGDLFLQYPTMAAGGDNVADPLAPANANGRLRYRRNFFADWHAAWAGASRNTIVTNSDGLLSTPHGPGAFLSSGGLQLPIGFYQRIEVVQVAVANADQGPHGRPAQVRMPSEPDLAAIPAHATLTTLNQFKANLLGVYTFDLRAVGFNASTAVNFPERGMSSTQIPATESAYLENLFAANITQPTTVNYWGGLDVDPITTGTQNLWSWYCFSFASSTLECRAETPDNVVNSPFARADYYRWKATANAGLTVADAAATAGQWIYLGSVVANVPVNPIIQDQGVTRFWRFRFSFAGFGTTNNHPSNTEAALASGDVVRVIGTDASGNGISTLTYVLP